MCERTSRQNKENAIVGSFSEYYIYRKTLWTFVSSSIPLSPWQSLHWITALCLALRGAVTILTYHLQLCSDKRCLKQAFDRTSSGQGQFQIFFFFSLLLLTLGAGHLLLVFSLRLNTPKAPPIDIEQPWPRAWARAGVLVNGDGAETRDWLCAPWFPTLRHPAHTSLDTLCGPGHMNIQTRHARYDHPRSSPHAGVTLHATQCQIKCLGLNHQRSNIVARVASQWEIKQ